MMQSPSSLSDSGRGAESPNSNPDSPLASNNNNNNSRTPNKETRSYDDENKHDIKTKFTSVLSAINKDNNISSTTLSRNNNLDQILYPKSSERDLIEPSAKFSIERLKQLADQRLSPSNIENTHSNNNNNNNTNNKLFEHKFQANSGAMVVTSIPSMNIDISHPHPIFSNHHHQPLPPHHLHILSHNGHLNNLKYAALLPSVNNLSNSANSNNNNNNDNNSPPSELDIERIKLARTLSNGKELSDFGFRIQLGGLTTNYAHSETHSDSEELNVDGNEDSSQGENSVSCV